jgi:tetratricopeptide (TPR) repeat protein
MNVSNAHVLRSIKLRPWIGAVLIVVAVGLAWANSISAPFELDDDSSIVTNESIRNLASWRWLSPPATLGETVSGRPVLNFSFALNYAVAGRDVRWYRVSNIAIHTMAALLLFGVVRRTLLLCPQMKAGDRSAAGWFAFAASLLWAVHPLQTEAVTYVVQRAESLAGFLYLLCLYCFIRLTDKPVHSQRWTIGCVFACLLGMATKETVATAPLVVLLYDRVFVAGSFAAAWRGRWRIYTALAATWIVLGVLILKNSGRGGSAGLDSSVNTWSYLLTQGKAVVHYVALALWPAGQVFDYGIATVASIHEVALELFFICAVVVATAWLLWRNRILGFLLACFFLALAPSSSFVPIATQTIAEHRMYLALAPVILIFSFGVSSAFRAIPTFPVWAGLALLSLPLGALTFVRNRVYATELTLWRDTVAKVPNNPRARNNLGIALAKAGHTDDAVVQYLRVIELQPNHAFAHFNLGNALITQHRWAEAAVHFGAALAIDPHYINARFNLGRALMQLDRSAEAIEQFRAVLREDNGAQDARTNLASLLVSDGKLEEGTSLLREVLATTPDQAEAHYQLGLALEKSGTTAAAEIEFREAARLKPSFAPAHLATGNIAMGRGDTLTAEASYREAIRLDPNLAEAQYALGNGLAQQQQFEAAMNAYREALVIDPVYFLARNNLANCQLATGKLQDAVANYEEALRLQPNDESVRQNLEIARQLLRTDTNRP